MSKTILAPIPVKVRWMEGVYRLGKETGIGIDERITGKFDFIVKTAEECLLQYTDSKCVRKEKDAAEIVFEKSDTLFEEAYEIKVTADGITVLCGAAVGAFRAMCTLKQIIAQQGNSISYVEIYDKPDFAERGIMLDISRGKIPKIETLKQIAQMLADLKYNQLHLYFENFSFAYDQFPEYWKDTEPLTAEEIHELDAFCIERFIELIPIQNSFGHMGVWLNQKELSHLSIKNANGNPSGTINPLDPESLKLIEKIYDSIFPHFSSDKVNIGFDEAFELGTGETKEACEKYGIGNVFAEYLCKISDLVTKKYHKKVMFFHDMLENHPECWDKIPKDSSALVWGYDSWSTRFDKCCAAIKSAGLNLYLYPGTSNWCSFTGRAANMIHNIRNSAEVAKDYGAKGMVLTDWGEGGHPQCLPVSYLSYAIAACYSWNGSGSVIESDETRSKLSLMESWLPSFIEPVIVETSEKYLDQFVFHCAEGKSVSDIIYRMGKYVDLENECLGNTTHAYEMYNVGFGRDGYNMQKGCMKEVDPVYFENAARYMQDIIRDLKACKLTCEDGDLVLRELIFDCRLVEMMERALVIQHDYYNDRITDELRKDAKALADELYGIEEEFLSLWKARNHTAGCEIVIRYLKRTADALAEV